MQFMRSIAFGLILFGVTATPVAAAANRATDANSNADCDCKEARKVAVQSTAEQTPVRKKTGDRTRRVLM